MDFSSPQPYSLFVCDRCHGNGDAYLLPCGVCRGMGTVAEIGGRVLYYGEPLSLYGIRRRRMRRTLHRVELGAAGVCALVFAIIGIFFEQDLFFSLLFVCVILYRLMNEEEGETIAIPQNTNDHGSPSATLHGFDDARYHTNVSGSLEAAHIGVVPRQYRTDIAKQFSPELRRVIERSVLRAKKQKSSSVDSTHLCAELLRIPDIQGVFLRLGLTPRMIQDAVRVTAVFSRARNPRLSDAFLQTIFRAYEMARQKKATVVGVGEMLLACVEMSVSLQEAFYDLSIDRNKLWNVLEWVRMRETLRERRKRFFRMGAHRSKYGIDRAMTAVATPFLNAYSQDLTSAARYGYIPPSAPRDKEIEAIFRDIDAGKTAVLLVGDAGVGKMTIIEDIAMRMVGESVPRALRDKRLVQLSTSALLAGTTVSGAQERLIRIIAEIRRAGNVALFIHQVHDLVSIHAAGGDSGIDVAKTLAEYGGQSGFVLFATATPDGYSEHIVANELGSLFTKISVPEMEENEAIRALESRVGMMEYQDHVFFSYPAIESATRLSKRFLHDRPLPASAIDVLSEAGGMVRSKRGKNQLVTAEDVALIIEEKTGIPKTTVSGSESEKLQALETSMHERVIGQDEAVTEVANALRRARAEIRSGGKPIASFLFAGPTGVGKTELAKTIASVYFGGESRMIRLDMSEFQDAGSIVRLLGYPGRQGSGLLAEPIRQHPFSLVLLDEFEKASPEVLNVFLQVFDDGRLTDSASRVIDCTSTIIVATSNAGTSYIQDALREGKSIETIHEALIRTELKKYFHPELLNRFDGIIVFHPLRKDQMKAIAKLMLSRIAKDLDARGVGFRTEDAALDDLVEVGFDPEYGARPLRRAIQDRVENRIADVVLSGNLKRRDTVVLEKGFHVRVEHA